MVGAFFPVQPIKATEFCLVKAFLPQNQVTGQVDNGNGLLFSFHEEKSSQVITVLTFNCQKYPSAFNFTGPGNFGVRA